MATFIGVRVEGTCHVYRLDPPICSRLTPDPKRRDKYPCGLEWGYRGAGPAQLAHSIIKDVTDDLEVTELLYQRFKHDVISVLPRAGWIMESEYVEEWIMRQITPEPQVIDATENLPEGF
jgi:hypothetical protein